MTTDPTPLQERIARAMYAHSTHELPWGEAHPLVRGYFQRRAAAVLPIIRAAQADALREAAGDIVWSAETLPDMTPHDAARGLVRRADDIEKEDLPRDR